MEGEQEMSTSVGKGGTASFEVPMVGQTIETPRTISDVSKPWEQTGKQTDRQT